MVKHIQRDKSIFPLKLHTNPFWVFSRERKVIHSTQWLFYHKFHSGAIFSHHFKQVVPSFLIKSCCRWQESVSFIVSSLSENASNVCIVLFYGSLNFDFNIPLAFLFTSPISVCITVFLSSSFLWGWLIGYILTHLEKD